LIFIILTKKCAVVQQLQEAMVMRQTSEAYQWHIQILYIFGGLLDHIDAFDQIL